MAHMIKIKEVCSSVSGVLYLCIRFCSIVILTKKNRKKSIGRRDWFLYAMRSILYTNMTARVATLFLRELSGLINKRYNTKKRKQSYTFFL